MNMNADGVLKGRIPTLPTEVKKISATSPRPSPPFTNGGEGENPSCVWFAGGRRLRIGGQCQKASVLIYRWPELPPLPVTNRPVLVRVATDGNRPVARQQLRSVLRQILACWSGLAAAELPLQETERGPVWHGLLAGESLDISLSYTAAEGWLALCRGAAVGVDAMVIAAFAEMADVARLYLGPDAADSLAKAADPATLFAQAWTRREAELKCLKRGLTEWSRTEALPPVKRFAVTLADAPGLAVAVATGLSSGGSPNHAVEPRMDTNQIQ